MYICYISMLNTMNVYDNTPTNTKHIWQYVLHEFQSVNRLKILYTLYCSLGPYSRTSYDISQLIREYGPW